MIKKGTLYIILKRCTVAWGLICDTPSTDNSYDYNYCHHLSNQSSASPRTAENSLAWEGNEWWRLCRDLVGRGDCSQAHNAHSLQVIPFAPWTHLLPHSPFFVSLLFLYTSLAYLAVSCLMRHVMCHVMWRPQKLTWNHYSLVEKIAGSSAGKESTCNAEDPGSIPGSRISSGEGIGYPLQYSWASLVAQTVKNLPPMQETWVRSLGQEDPLEEGRVTHSSILA